MSLNYNYFDTEHKYGICNECFIEFPDTRYPCIVDKKSPENISIKKLPHWCKNAECFNYTKPKVKDPKDQKFIFITIQDFKRRMCDLDKLEQFIKNIKYLFTDGLYCIETGKVPLPDSNLHIHILGRYVNSKKAKNRICIEWAKLFDTNLRDQDFWHVKQHRDTKEMPPYEQWLQEKKDYFIDEMKGNHSNVVDLGARGAWGVATSVIDNP